MAEATGDQTEEEQLIPVGQHGGYRPNSGRKPSAATRKKAGRPVKTEQADAYTVLAKAKAKHEHFRAQQAELEYKRAAGEQIAIEEVARHWEALVHTAKGRLLALPSRLAPELLHLTELRAIELRLREAIVIVLDELASESTVTGD